MKRITDPDVRHLHAALTGDPAEGRTSNESGPL